MRNGLIIDEYGVKYYYVNDLLHREDGPAEEHNNGHKEWYKHGKFHREDGPAVEWADGYKQWYYDGKYIDVRSQEEFDRYLRLMVFK